MTGYVFTAVERSIRRAPKQEEIQVVLQSVVGSVILCAPLTVHPFLVPKKTEEWVANVLILSSHAAYGLCLGLVWAAARPYLMIAWERASARLAKRWKLLSPALNATSAAHAAVSTKAKFAKRVGNNQVRLKLKGDKTYWGCIRHQDTDPEDESEGYLILEHLWLKTESDRAPLPGIKSMLIRMEDIESIAEVVERPGDQLQLWNPSEEPNCAQDVRSRLLNA